MVDLSGKVALVTGAGRGIGRATALALAEAGADVALAAKSPEEINAVAEDVRNRGRRALAVPTDVSIKEQVAHLVRQTLETLGKIDVLVNAAGVGWRAPLEASTAEMWEQTIAVNLSGTYWCCRAVWSVMRQQGGGLIVNISSGLGRRGRANWSAYSASKFGVVGLSECLAQEGKPLGIRVNIVSPGPTNTLMREQIYPGEDPSLRQPPEAVAEVIVWLAAEEAANIVGQDLSVRP